MNLPKISIPEYFMELPSNKAQIKYRPFLVKEEKILLMAMQESNEDVLINAIKTIIRNCTFDSIDVDKLTKIDLEYIFLKIKIVSKGDTISDLLYRCENMVPDDKGVLGKCGAVIELEIPLNDVKVVEDANHTNKIMISDTLGIKMKYPTIDDHFMIQKLNAEDNNVNTAYELFAGFVEYVFDEDSVFSEFTTKEMVEWLENLTEKDFDKIKKFFETAPKLHYKTQLCCSVCNHVEDIELTGLQSFLV